MGYSFKIQKAYAKREASYGTATGDFSGATGYILRNADGGPIDVSSVDQKLSPVSFTLTSTDTITPAANAVIEDVTLTMKHVFSGASLSGTVAIADGLDTHLTNMLGDKVDAGANDVVGSGATTITVPFVSGTSYEAGMLVRIGTETRRISAVSGSVIKFALPLTSLPTSGTAIENVICYKSNADDGYSVEVGLKHLATNADYLIAGIFAEKVKLNTINNSDVAIIEITARGQSSDIGTGKITASSTNDMYQRSNSAKAGGKLQMLRADGSTLLTLQAKEAECDSGMKNIPVSVFTNTNGIAGFVNAPEDDLGSLSVVVWEADSATRELVKALETKTTEVVVQLGTTRGYTCGMYFPQAALKDSEPRFVDMDGVIGIKMNLKTSAGWFFRA